MTNNSAGPTRRPTTRLAIASAAALGSAAILATPATAAPTTIASIMPTVGHGGTHSGGGSGGGDHPGNRSAQHTHSGLGEGSRPAPPPLHEHE